ncbi:hypothetical protein U8335_13815 [Roseiconus lacunae]|uniref:hypothetical protein n=1 Tax=Roseiconus lacunae TaxID=2605694 RepID=UPI003085B974|nr:hypothetical protein U8335_13815 [Stieleria sp. HD01]
MATEAKASRRGIPTRHRIRFQSERWVVEGGIQSENAKDICEYDGFLFDSFHTDSHLCVLVGHQDGWYRSDAWHGMVAKGNVIHVAFVDEDDQVVTTEELDELINDDFRSAWGEFCRTSD